MEHPLTTYIQIHMTGTQKIETRTMNAAYTALSLHMCLQVSSREEAIAFSNLYAPEHLIINTADAEDWLPHITDAGSVFLGRWTPESVGDYASGTNHTLPTYGYARMYSGVSLDSFVKKMTVQKLTQEGLQVIIYSPHWYATHVACNVLTALRVLMAN